MTDNVQQSTSTPAVAIVPVFGRDRLARLVVVGSFLSLFLLVGVLLVLEQRDADGEASKAATNAFNAILPVLSGWVGTVLAFYFSAVSQERTSDTLDRMLGQTGSGASDSAPVTTKMIPLASVRHLQEFDAEKTPDTIKLTDLKALFEDSSKGPVTRLLFTENGVFRYVIHIGTFDAFVVKNTNPSTDPNVPTKTIEDFTLRDMLRDADTLHTISKLVVFVSSSATIGDAQAALATVNGAQDIIVTATGNASVPVLGWLTNTDLTKALPAN